MRTRKLTLRHVGSALTCAGLSLAGSPALAIEYWLKADVTTVTVAGTPVPMWGYALCGTGTVPAGWPNACSGAGTVPGPALTVPVGDTSLTVHLRNNLGVPTSLVINGLIKPMAPVWTTDTDALARRRVRSFDAEAAANGLQDYTWSNVKPGTYLYQSGTQPQVQVQMGLYGMVGRNERDADSTTRARAYADDLYQYDNQAVLLYSEIDPAMHAAINDGSYGTSPAPTSTINYAPKYFLINGQAYPELPTIAPTGAGGTTLLRLLNAGLTTRVPMAMGRHWDVIAEDGKPYSYVEGGTAKPQLRSQYTALLPAAKTLDVLVQHQPGTGRYAIVDRRLGLSNNGAQGVGGMMAFVLPGPGAGGGGAGGVPGGGSGGGNQPPVAVNDPAAGAVYETVTGVALNVAATGVLANDSDPNLSQAITAVAATNAATSSTTTPGTYTLNTNGSFTLTGPTGTHTFTYQARDPFGALSGAATVTVAVIDPVAPTLAAALDSFDTAGSLSANWAYASDGTNYVGVGAALSAAATGTGGLAVWNATTFGGAQYAAFTNSTSLAGASLILKATGGNLPSQPNGYIEVRHTGGAVEVYTVGSIGSGGYTEVLQASFAGASGSGTLSAKVDFKGLVTVFLNGTFVGGIQLPSWTAGGNIGVKLGSGAAVDDFVGGNL